MANNTTNEVRATAKYVRVAPRKARAVVGLIRNLPVAKALEVLQFNTRAVSEDISKVLRSAVANAVDAQIGVRVSSIDVCIDELIFPKE